MYVIQHSGKHTETRFVGRKNDEWTSSVEPNEYTVRLATQEDAEVAADALRPLFPQFTLTVVREGR